MDKEYYIPAGFDLKVKQGDKVEAGDVLSEGIVNPSDVVRLKGIGEGRVYFAKAMKQAFDDAGMGGVNKRNFELIAKNIVDHVIIDHPEGIGNHLSGSVASYQSIEKAYKPRPDAITARVDQAYNKYLEKPELHYTIGTRLTEAAIKNLQKHNINNVVVHKDSPGFSPDMQRLYDIPMYENDWMHQLYSTNLEKRLIQAVNTGMQSNVKGPSPIPGLAYGVGFREKLPIKRAFDYGEMVDMALDQEEDDEDKLSFE